jgi:3-methyladenine DNA glycosylase AlkD
VTTAAEVLARLAALADPSRLAGMARYGIPTQHAYGVTLPEQRTLARGLGRDHELAAALWATGVHEARIVASLVDDPALVDEAQFERWAHDFDSWDLCDQVCQNLFRRTPRAYAKAVEWTAREELFVKRAGFALMAGLVVADKQADDARFAALLEPLAAGADDDRDLVRKGASWALRSIGKRSAALNELAIGTALELAGRTGRGARWVGADALRELRSPPVQARFAARDAGPPALGGTHA